MGRLFLVTRLAARDLRRRKGETVMLLIVVPASTCMRRPDADVLIQEG